MFVNMQKPCMVKMLNKHAIEGDFTLIRNIYAFSFH